MDPYAVFQLKGEKFKTPVAENGHRNPRWEFSFIANLDGDEDAVHIKVKNKGNVTDDLMCRCDIELPNLDLSGKPAWYSLRDPDQFTKECGEISLSFTFEGNGLPMGSKALQTHQQRTAGPGVQPMMSPISPLQPQQQQQYQSQPPQYQTQPPQQQYAQPPQQQFQQPQQPQYAQQPQYQQPMQQPQYQQPQAVYQQPAPMYQQQPAPMYQQPAPVYQQPAPVYVQQQPQVVYQPAPAPQVQVVYTQSQPAPTGFMGGLMSGLGALANNLSQGVNSLVTRANKGKWDNAGYLALHPDVKAAGMDGFQHWKNRQTMPPCTHAAPLVVTLDISLSHSALCLLYILCSSDGYKENRVIQLTNGLRGRFDPAGYHALHPDVKNHPMDAFFHYSNHGRPNPRCDEPHSLHSAARAHIICVVVVACHSVCVRSR
jgi:hypothetical protein